MDKSKNFAAFRRIWTYVWPQKRRVIAVLFWSIIISIMFSTTITTVIPLLKVMMGEEGLHGWIDRNVCNWRYGVNFYVPDVTELQSEEGKQKVYQLLVTGIDENSWAQQAGLKVMDRIIGAGSHLATENNPIPSLELLEVLSSIESDQETILQVRRDIQGKVQDIQLQAQTPSKPFYVNIIQKVVSFVPRGAGKKTTQKAIVLIIFCILIITIFRCTARFYQTYMAEKIVWTVVTKIREEIFSHAMFMPVSFFASKGTSDTTSRILADVAMCSKGIKTILSKTVREFFIALGLMVVCFGINWQLTLIFLTGAPAAGAVLAIFGKRIKKASKKALVSTAQMLGRIQGAMEALRVVKVYNRQEHEIQKYRERNQKILKYMLKTMRIESATNPIMEVLAMIAGFAALLIGVDWITDDKMQASNFFALLFALGVAAESFRKVSNVGNQVQQANAAAERVFEIIDQPQEPEEPDAFDLKPIEKHIAFQEIVFTYPGATQPVLHEINLTVPAGQTIAIVGPNGSGKSTLINLIPRFYDPDSGKVCIDGQDIKECTFKSLRDQIGMVTQNIATFNTTVAENIAYGKPEATQEEIIDAAQKAYAHEFIEPLPEGYNTLIGEQSSGFSGGQLQRIVIARAILKDPAILIFDEAMSQIDADSEAKIHEALSELMKGHTCFIIAHRFSTIVSADQIVVMDQGKIVSIGTHDELAANCQLYKSLYETQLLVS